MLDGNAGGIHYANGPISFDPYKAVFLSRPAYQWAYNVMTHELGHYFGLDHTHQFNDKGRCRREPVSRTRKYALISFCKPLGSRTMCESTGDALRDTPADPDLRSNGGCNSYNLGGLDHFGDAYNDNPPLLNNFMSYNSSACQSAFTRLQVAVMLNAIERDMLNVSNRVAWSNAASMFDTYEPDNSVETAGNITRCEVQERNFHMQRNTGISYSSCDADLVRYVAPLNETIDIYTSAVSGRATVNTSLFVYDSSNNLIVSNDDKAPSDIYSRVSLTTTASTTYFIKIVNNSTTSGGFYKLGIGSDMTGMSISGPSSFCTTETYSIPNLPAGATVNWSASPSLVTVTPLNVEGSSVLLTKVNSLSGSITATISTSCGSIVLNKTITVGVPDANYNFGTVSNMNGSKPLSAINCLVENNNPSYPNMYNSDVSVYNSGATSYQWTLVSKTPATAIAQVFDLGNGNATINLRPFGSSLVAKLTISNSCGTVNTNYTFNSDNFCVPIEEMFIYYPNPSSTELKITHKESKSGSIAKLAVQNSFSVKLLNEKGKVLKEGKATASIKEIVLHVADVPNGIYYLHIYEGEKISKQQVVIAH